MTPSELNRYLQGWDNGTKANRAKMLSKFIEDHKGKTAPELEQSFGSCASLFMTRLTAWLRLSYMTSIHLGLQLQAIHVFVSSSNGHKFLSEFIEVGGILTLLEVLGLPQIPETVKVDALGLIVVIADSGRKYKELICECFGIRGIAQCLARSNNIDCHDICKNILKELSTGNPRYQNQVYKAMIALLKSASPEAQRIAAQILLFVQPMIETASISIIDPCLLLLRSLHLEVLYEGCELIKLLMSYGNVRDELMLGLVALLKPSKIDMQNVADKDEETVGNIKAPLPVYIQQAAAARMVGVLSRESREYSDSFLKLNVVHSLVLAMSNDKYADSQKQAGVALQHFIHTYEEVEMKVREAMGQSFFFQYMSNPDTFFINATTIQLDILSGNKISIISTGADMTSQS